MLAAVSSRSLVMGILGDSVHMLYSGITVIQMDDNRVSIERSHRIVSAINACLCHNLHF